MTGNGAAELIYAIAAAFEPGRLPCWGRPLGNTKKALRIHGWQVMHYLARREEGYRFTEKALEWLEKEEGLSAVFLCNPNNPTGMLADGGVLEKLADLCHRKQMLLVVDECFLELTGQGEGKISSASAGTIPGDPYFTGIYKNLCYAGTSAWLCTDS